MNLSKDCKGTGGLGWVIYSRLDKMRENGRIKPRTVGGVMIDYASVDEVLQLVYSSEEFWLDYPCRFVFGDDWNEGRKHPDVNMSTERIRQFN